MLASAVLETALTFAARYGHTTIVQILDGRRIKDFPSEPLSADTWGLTPLHQACRHGHVDVVLALLSRDDTTENTAKALLGLKTNRGETPLMFAATSGHETTTALLLEKGADLGSENNAGQTAVWLAAEKGQITSLQVLLEHPTCNKVLDKPEKVHDKSTGLGNSANQKISNRSCTFLFINANKLRECNERILPTCRVLKARKGWVKERTIHIRDALGDKREAFREKYLAVSHRWEKEGNAARTMTPTPASCACACSETSALCLSCALVCRARAHR